LIQRVGGVLISRPRRVGAISLVLLLLCVASWWLTVPLEQNLPKDPAPLPVTDAAAGSAQPQPELPPWPNERLEGPPAKELLLATLKAVDRSFRKSHCCMMTFRKQERINGKLMPEETYFLKVRQEPFAVYMKCLEPVPGRELIYAEGQYDNHVIGHPSGLARLLVPRIKVPPNHSLIMAESRHPVSEAGLANMISKMIHYREMDLADPESITILDRTTGPDGRNWLRSTHIHPVLRPDRPLVETEVLYEPETRLPLRFTGYDRPGPGEREKRLGERYSYDDLVLDAELSAEDFDPANPVYGFHRF
jgi:hypothetical protein